MTEEEKTQKKDSKEKTLEDSVKVLERGQGIKVVPFQINSSAAHFFNDFRLEELHPNVFVGHFLWWPSIGSETLFLGQNAERVAKEGRVQCVRAPDAALQKRNAKHFAGRRNISVLLEDDHLSYVDVEDVLVARHVGWEVSTIEEFSDVEDGSGQFDGIWPSLQPPHHPCHLRPLGCSLFVWANSGLQGTTKSLTAGFVEVPLFKRQVSGN